jgi:hypothetical protein
MRLRRLSLTAALVVLGGLAFAASAPACSCAPLKPAEALRESDAAIVGRLIEVVPQDGLRSDFRYRVLRVYKGRRSIERGGVLAVQSASDGAACGLPHGVGGRYGLFLGRKGGGWTSGLCAVISPRKLEALAARQPARRSGGGAHTSAGSTCSQGAP